MDIQRNSVRIEQTKGESDRLQAEIGVWTQKRRQNDKLKLHFTQLNSLETSLTTALEVLRSNIDSIPADQPVGTVYQECRRFDQRLLWVRRGWSYFQSKFDQLDGPEPQVRQLLAAANEIIWSCYAGVFRKAEARDRTIKIRSAPLPYLDSYVSPLAILRGDPPKDLKSQDSSNLISDFLKELPIPVISLPPVCIQGPWWLIFLGHEVGHQIQYDLLPGQQLEIEFGSLLASAVMGKQESKDEWYKWGKEIFADTLSILYMGPWAVWAMTELLLADGMGLLMRHPLYPPPVVRLALMAQLADAFGVEGRIALHGFQPEMVVKRPVPAGGEELQKAAERDLEQIPKVVSTIKDQEFGTLGKLEDLCGWDSNLFKSRGQVYNRAQALRDRQPLYPDRALPGAKLFISGAVEAWAEVLDIDDTQKRQEEQAKLVKNILTHLPECREPSIRKATPVPDKDVGGLGEKLARRLMEASEEELGG